MCTKYFYCHINIFYTIINIFSVPSGGEMEGVASGGVAGLLLPPPSLELAQSGVGAGRGVWTRAALPPATRFGPFLGKWVLEPENEEFAWEVRELSFCHILLF